MITYTKEVPGRAHERSEDSSLEAILNNSSQKEWGLYMVADGLTAHNGTKASHTALAVIRNYLADNLKKGGGVVKEIIKEAVVLANEKLQDITVSCTTLDLILVSPDNIYLTHLGDSRIYFVYNDSLELMTEDQITSFGAPADYVGSTFVEGDSRPIGERLVVKQYQLSEYNISGIYLETDGVILKEEEKERFLLQIPQGANPKKILDQMATEIQSVKRRQSDIDDVTMLYVDLEDVVERERLNKEKEKVVLVEEKKQIEISRDKLILEKSKIMQERDDYQRELQDANDRIRLLNDKIAKNEDGTNDKIADFEEQLNRQSTTIEQLEIRYDRDISKEKEKYSELEKKHDIEIKMLNDRYELKKTKYEKDIENIKQNNSLSINRLIDNLRNMRETKKKIENDKTELERKLSEVYNNSPVIIETSDQQKAQLSQYLGLIQKTDDTNKIFVGKMTDSQKAYRNVVKEEKPTAQNQQTEQTSQKWYTNILTRYKTWTL